MAPQSDSTMADKKAGNDATLGKMDFTGQDVTGQGFTGLTSDSRKV